MDISTDKTIASSAVVCPAITSSISTLDVEASGIHPESYPIEVGLVLNNGKSWCSLIKPDDSWTHWDREAEAIHGISREQLLCHGKTPTEVAQELNQLIKNTTIYSDCWVLDQPWLTKLFEKAKIRQTFNLQDMMYTLGEDDYDKLYKTKQEVIADTKIERHRASNDARILQMAYKKIRNIH